MLPLTSMTAKNFSEQIYKKFDKQINKMSFEDSMARLEEIAEKLSSQKISLDEMMLLFEEGKLLKDKCSKTIEEAKMRFSIVNQKEND